MAGWDDINVYDFKLGTLDAYAALLNSALHLTAEKQGGNGNTVSYQFHLYDISGRVLERFDITDDADSFRYFRNNVRYTVLDHMVGHISKLYRIEKDPDKNILSRLYLRQYPEAENISRNLPGDISVTATKVCVKCPDGTVIGVEKKKETSGFTFVLFTPQGDILQEGDVGDSEDEQFEYSARDAIAITADKAGYLGSDRFIKVSIENYLDEYDYQKYLKQKKAKKASSPAR